MLPEPIRYFPIRDGRYSVSAGLRPLGHAFGGGAGDALAFQFDRDFPRFRQSKLACRIESIPKYIGECRLQPEVAAGVARWLATHLAAEHPAWFHWEEHSTEEAGLTCSLTGERLCFDGGMRLTNVEAAHRPAPPYQDALDALICQVPEDVAIVSSPRAPAPSGSDWLSYVHVCSPSVWAPVEKLGLNFMSVHAPVPGIERLRPAADLLVDAMVRRGPLVRFVWSCCTDDRLNHHPAAPPGVPAEAWRGRKFDPSLDGCPFYIRTERQVMWGFPALGASVFLIRVYLLDAREIRKCPLERDLLKAGLLSMSPESRKYKGVAEYLPELLEWLDAGSG
jgi:hypothetical protein